MDKYELKLSSGDIQYIINVLSEKPYNEVFQLINDILCQFEDQNGEQGQ